MRRKSLITMIFLQVYQGDIQNYRGDNSIHPVKIGTEELSPPYFGRRIVTPILRNWLFRNFCQASTIIQVIMYK